MSVSSFSGSFRDVGFHQEDTLFLSHPQLSVISPHHDCKLLQSIEMLHRFRKNGFSQKDILALCDSHLDPNDGDWVRAGMELGMIKDMVLFGFDDSKHSYRLPESHEDATGEIHKIKILWLPGQALGCQGELSDWSPTTIFRELWNILDWQFTPKVGFKFGSEASPIWLNFDLDCFVMRWREYKFVWPDVVFETEFHGKSTYWSTKGWSGKSFVDKLITKAGLITIAREPDYCGGTNNADKILNLVNHYFFNDNLKI